jgi:hypothetical protein
MKSAGVIGPEGAEDIPGGRVAVADAGCDEAAWLIPTTADAARIAADPVSHAERRGIVGVRLISTIILLSGQAKKTVVKLCELFAKRR